MSDGTVYVYMDSENLNWTYSTNITKEESAIGHTVAQMYAPTENYNNVCSLKTNLNIGTF